MKLFYKHFSIINFIIKDFLIAPFFVQFQKILILIFIKYQLNFSFLKYFKDLLETIILIFYFENFLFNYYILIFI